MALSWISRSRGAADVDTLVARGRYGKAAKVLRASFEGRQPTIAERLRFADVLVLASRGDDALPVLLGVADEQLRYGFLDKALEALRRAEAIDPAHPQVRNRIRALRDAARRDGGDGSAEPRPDDEEGGDWGSALDGAFATAAGSPADTTASETAPNADRVTDPADSHEDDDGGAVDSPASGEAELLLSEHDLEPDEPEVLLSENDLEPDEPETLLSEADLEPYHAEERRAVRVRVPGTPRPLLTEEELDAEEELLPPAGAAKPDLVRLHAFLLALGRTQSPERPALGAALFADFPGEQLPHVASGLRRRRFAPGDVLVSEGDPGDSVFVIARGSVRILVLGGHGQPFDVRRLDSGDSFGEVAVLSGWPRTATVVAATPGEALEIGRAALDTLLALRPGARRLLEEQAGRRAQSPEEKAVRSLPPEAADPARAAAALRAHFGGSEWSFQVRLHLAQLMLDVGRQEEALAILAGVAEDLARRGHAQKAIAVLKNVEWIRRRGIHEIPLAPLRRGRKRSPRPRSASATGAASAAAPSRAATGAAFREWVGSLLRETHALAARPAPSSPEEEDAKGEGEGDGQAVAQHSA